MRDAAVLEYGDLLGRPAPGLGLHQITHIAVNIPSPRQIPVNAQIARQLAMPTTTFITSPTLRKSAKR